MSTAPPIPQLDRIRRAVDFIEEHLFDDLTIETIAARAAYSPWHFQRLFGALVGETVGGYVRKRRLSRALEALRASDARIAEIAWAHGFESHEAFARAFKATFGVTPSTARTRCTLSAAPLHPIVLSDEFFHQRYGERRMEPTIKEIGAMNVIGVGAPFTTVLSPETNNITVIPALWDTLFKRIDEIEGARHEVSIGLTSDLPDGMERTQEGQFFYVAGVAAPDDAAIPDGMTNVAVPARRYAVFTHRGPLDGLKETYSHIYGSWLPRSDYERAGGDAPDLELYDERFKMGSPESAFDICVPVE
jgi:AraC family transcriptional regulator